MSYEMYSVHIHTLYDVYINIFEVYKYIKKILKELVYSIFVFLMIVIFKSISQFLSMFRISIKEIKKKE